jgi:hypothetical protein
MFHTHKTTGKVMLLYASGGYKYRGLQEIRPDFVEEAMAISWAVEPRK